jgi:Na+-transporting methylmalonyl-CoA/oxaloacetate decarboxylase gamma subunit
VTMYFISHEEEEEEVEEEERAKEEVKEEAKEAEDVHGLCVITHE